MNILSSLTICKLIYQCPYINIANTRHIYEIASVNLFRVCKTVSDILCRGFSRLLLNQIINIENKNIRQDSEKPMKVKCFSVFKVKFLIFRFKKRLTEDDCFEFTQQIQWNKFCFK